MPYVVHDRFVAIGIDGQLPKQLLDRDVGYKLRFGIEISYSDTAVARLNRLWRNTVPDRAALHEQDGLLTIPTNWSGRQAKDILRWRFSKDALERLR